MTTITTLIPAYRPDYLGEVFLGLKTQHLRDFRVVLSDDSPGGAITDAIRRGVWDALIDGFEMVVVPGPRAGCFRNIQHLLQQWNGATPLVHLQMDDDVIYPDFYRLHAMTHASAALGASVSRRWLAGADGRPQAALPLPELVAQQPQRVLAIGGEAIVATTIASCTNWLGEFSNAVLGRAAAARLRDAMLGGLSYYGLADIGVLIDVSQDLPIGFVHEHLGVFRTHASQRSAATASHGLRCGYLAWAALALGAQAARRLDAAGTRQAVNHVARIARQQYRGDDAFDAFVALVDAHGSEGPALHAAFRGFWHALLATDADSCEAVREAALPACADAAAA
ncbi:MAG: hypothetical protein U1E89_00735 [Burkholderiaceae bacterium]